MLQDVQAQKITIRGVYIGDIYQLPKPPPIWANVPSLPNHFLGQDQLVEELVLHLTKNQNAALAVHGLPGSGKSALAVVLAHHPDILDHFADGILWASLGPTFNIRGQLTAWANELGISLNDKAPDDDCAQAVRNAIGQRKILLIIDDAWQADTAQLMRCGGPKCKHILTTRDLSVARAFAGTSKVFKVSPLQESYAFQLLQMLAPDAISTDPAKVRQIALAVGGLPLALVLIGSFLAFPEHSLFSELGESSLEELANPTHRLQLASQRLGSVSSHKVTLQDTISLSLDYLSPTAVNAFYALGAFAPNPASFDLNSAQFVTGVDLETLAVLVARNLVELHDSKRLALHQVLFDVARTKVKKDERMRHAICYATVALRIYQDYIEGPKDYLKNHAKHKHYQDDEVQIGCAYRWALDQEPTIETDKLLINFTNLPAFVVFAEPSEITEKIARLGAGVAAADRIPDIEASSKFRRVLAFYQQTKALILAQRGNLSTAKDIYQQAINTIQFAKNHPIDWIHAIPGQLGRSYADLLGDSLEYLLHYEMGNAYRDLSEPAKAIECYQYALDFVQRNGGIPWYDSLLNDIFRAHFQLQQYQKASEYLKLRLPILQQNSDKKSDLVETLGNLGACAFNLGDKQAALNYAISAIETSQKGASVNPDPKLTASAGMDLVTIPWDEAKIVNGCLAMAAEISDEFNKPDKAKNFRVYQVILLLQLYKQHTTTRFEQTKILAGFFGKSKITEYQSEEKDILQQSVSTLEKLTSYYLEKENIQEAIVCRELQLGALHALNDQTGLAFTLGALGLLYNLVGNMDRSFAFYEQCIGKMRETRNDEGLIFISQTLGYLYIIHNDYDHAAKILNQAQKVAHAIKDAQSELNILKNLGIIHILMLEKPGQSDSKQKALKYIEAGYALAIKLGDQKAQTELQDTINKLKEMLEKSSPEIQGNNKRKGKSGSRRR